MYYGTDTRCSELLAGGVLGLALAGRSLPSAPSARRAIEVLGVVGLAINLYMWGTAAVDSDGLYRGGILVYTLGSLAVITATLLPGGPIRLLMQAEWLQYIGRLICVLRCSHVLPRSFDRYTPPRPPPSSMVANTRLPSRR